MENTAINRNVDIVFCIDGTGSMSPIMDDIKESAVRFYTELCEECYAHGANISALRVRIITFRDYETDGAAAMEESSFFELPADDDLFSSYLQGIVPDGGGDAPENGLEALHFAFRSDFVTGPKDRQVIVLITDADALPLLARKGRGCYPEDMSDEDKLINTWAGAVQDPNVKLGARAKRLVFFAPADTAYQTLSTKLKGSIFQVVPPGQGLRGINFKDIVKVIAASVGGQ